MLRREFDLHAKPGMFTANTGMFQMTDHPVPAAFAEGLYLKAVVARVDKR